MKHYPIRASITDRSSISVNLYLKEISKYPLLTDEQESELIKKVKDGDEKARNKLITSNLRFVISISKQYQGKGVEFPDLISAGTEGLIKSVSHYDPTYGCKFISYAVWWIRDSILKEIIEHGKPIRIPVDKISKLNKVNKLISEFEQEHARVPSLQELSELSELSENDLREIIDQCTICLISDSVKNSDGELESLFDTLYTEEGNTEQTLQQESTSKVILDFLKTNLNYTEYKVLTKFFGLEGPTISLEVIGEQLGITKERVRQIKDKAIIKLRKSDGVELLANFL